MWLEACGKSCLQALQEACFKHGFKPWQGWTLLILSSSIWALEPANTPQCGTKHLPVTGAYRVPAMTHARSSASIKIATFPFLHQPLISCVTQIRPLQIFIRCDTSPGHVAFNGQEKATCLAVCSLLIGQWPEAKWSVYSHQFGDNSGSAFQITL